MAKGGDAKYIAALEACSADVEILKAHRQYQRMDRVNLYAVLSERGYNWNAEAQRWEPRQTLTLVAPQQVRTVKAHNSTLNNVFLVRIMAPKSDIDHIEGELFEIAEALNWSISRDSREYANDGDGNWVRKYYTVKRG